MRSVILGTGHYVPEKIVPNEELAGKLGTTATWIRERTGILQRHYAIGGESTSDLAVHASRRALEDAGLEPADLDAIVFATLTPDATFPGSGVFLQRKLGLNAIPALDVRNQCSGFLYGLAVADAWIRAGMYKRVLLVGSEVHSVGLDFSEDGRDVTALFGDGAGAVVLEGREQAGGVLHVRLGADGRGAEQLWCEAPGTRLSPCMTREHIENKRHFPSMQGRSVFRAAVETLEREIRALARETQIEPEDAVFVPHQANRRITDMVAQRLSIPEDRIISTIERHGNTTAASIPSALDVARRDGRANPGDLVLMAAFGSGFTWGSALVRLT